MEQITQRGREPVLSVEEYQLGEKYQIGVPLARYNTRPQVLRWNTWHPRIMIIAGPLVSFAALILFCIFFYQLQLLSNQPPIGSYEAIKREMQVPMLQYQLILALLFVLLGFITSMRGLIEMRVVPRKLPVSVVVGTEGFLVMSPKGVDVTRWDEVTGFIRFAAHSFHVRRGNREPLALEKELEDIEGLASLVK